MPGLILSLRISVLEVLSNTLTPSRRANLCFGPVYRAIYFYTLRFFDARGPLCGIGVTSAIRLMEIPAALIARSALSLPLPGPLTNTSTALIPLATAFFAASSTASPAAYGVDFLAPLNPRAPDELQEIVSPLSLVMVTKVLLNVAVI